MADKNSSIFRDIALLFYVIIAAIANVILYVMDCISNSSELGHKTTNGKNEVRESAQEQQEIKEAIRRSLHSAHEEYVVRDVMEKTKMEEQHQPHVNPVVQPYFNGLHHRFHTESQSLASGVALQSPPYNPSYHHENETLLPLCPDDDDTRSQQHAMQYINDCTAPSPEKKPPYAPHSSLFAVD